MKFCIFENARYDRKNLDRDWRLLCKLTWEASFFLSLLRFEINFIVLASRFLVSAGEQCSILVASFQNWHLFCCFYRSVKCGESVCSNIEPPMISYTTLAYIFFTGTISFLPTYICSIESGDHLIKFFIFVIEQYRTRNRVLLYAGLHY